MSQERPKENPLLCIEGINLFPMCQARHQLIYLSTGVKLLAVKSQTGGSQFFSHNFDLRGNSCLIFIFTHDLAECFRLIRTPKEFLQAAHDFLLTICPAPEDGRPAETLMEKIAENIEAWLFEAAIPGQKISGN